jgi:peptidoglycan/LPS O-acetylase OafA/YrhL
VATSAGITLALGWWPVRSSAASSIASATYTMNWAELVISPVPRWFGHMWSLGIEEQFYLVWPLAVLGLSTLGGRARWRLAVGLLGTAWLWRAWLIGMHPMVERIRNGTDTRALGFVLGACLALLLERRSVTVEHALGGRWAALAGSAGLVACCFAVKVYSGSMFGTWMTAAACASALLIGHCAVNDSRGQRTGVTLALSSSPLVWLGDVSYSLYLWHPLVLEVVARASGSPYPSVTRATVGMMASVLFASASYYIVERRFHTPASARSGPVIDVRSQRAF